MILNPFYTYTHWHFLVTLFMIQNLAQLCFHSLYV